MNSKSLVFIFALLALFTLASADFISDFQKRDLEDDELLSDALSLMQKNFKEQGRQRKTKNC